MQQKVITVSKRMRVIDQYDFDLDCLTNSYNADGWVVRQVSSTSFLHAIAGSSVSYPVVSVTLLLEKER